MSAIGSVMSMIGSLASSPAKRAEGPDGSDFAEHMKSKFEVAAKTAGVPESEIPGLVKQIQDAIDEPARTESPATGSRT